MSDLYLVSRGGLENYYRHPHFSILFLNESNGGVETGHVIGATHGIGETAIAALRPLKIVRSTILPLLGLGVRFVDVISTGAGRSGLLSARENTTWYAAR
jgi:hypothetical protein